MSGSPFLSAADTKSILPDIRLDMGIGPATTNEQVATPFSGEGMHDFRVAHEMVQTSEGQGIYFLTNPASNYCASAQEDAAIQTVEDGVVGGDGTRIASSFSAVPPRSHVSVHGTRNLGSQNQPPKLPSDQPVRVDDLFESKIWTTGSPYVYRPELNASSRDHWETIKGGMDKYDKDICSAWNAELDTLLVYAGLFSAALTAFCIASFPTLSQNPADKTNALLVAISLQLANSSSPAASELVKDSFKPERHDVHINVLYFLSLALALSASTFCIVIKQWIREYQKDLAIPARDAVRVRQLRYDNLVWFQLPQAIDDLPLLLLSALALFFAGLLIQLWHANDHTAAICMSVIVAITSAWIIFTAIFPAIGNMSSSSLFIPFRSPQSWIFFEICYDILTLCAPAFLLDLKVDVGFSTWDTLDLYFIQNELYSASTSTHMALQWVIQRLRNTKDFEIAALACLQPSYHPPGIIEDTNQLGRYVLSTSESAVFLDLAYYEYTKEQNKALPMSKALQHGQVEMLIRSMNQAIDLNDWSEASKVITYCAEKLQEDHHICSHNYPQVEGKGKVISVEYEDVVCDQIFLWLTRLLYTFEAVRFPIGSPFDWDPVIDLLLWACDAPNQSTSQQSSRAQQGLVSEKTPTLLAKYSSPPLLCDLAAGVASWPKQRLSFFVYLDQLMVNICRGSDELDWGSIEKWRVFRRSIIDKFADNPSTEYPAFDDGYFDVLNGSLPPPSD